MSPGKGTRGGTPQQHAFAGAQSHKNTNPKGGQPQGQGMKIQLEPNHAEISAGGMKTTIETKK